ncbi:Peptidoglycan/LPS O-acetylase OafA/YrhL, contains acyltransferase and SGNH-hydrolase domains [Roseateles sp. YR242]|uniref:acyltransferase family protein n=1 Tax=Roseateles sp. YR242 TaxID=1855305 RepID=UPI0008D013E6|nr:acyltransferase [Roseateles sp. YR242]SEK69618.1 Peptidoglycan/LPS O-acetylase OafA/YrhL, contains acyltransferase and SGNH-hydrolase domains [Roseateles sp. YR242]
MPPATPHINTPPPLAPPRLHGLDLLRALAIVLVFTYHYALFVSGEPTFGWVSTLGWTGVDLFFVLSGYLIANQLMAGFRRGGELSLPRFYGRRLLRTLPSFYVVLALFWLFPVAMGGRPPPPLWRFLSFTQNVGLPPGTAFSHAWSLCIEEQFYLVLPATLALGWSLKRHRRALAWTMIGLLTVAACAWRDHLWQLYGREAEGAVALYHPHLYYASLARLDEFLPGVAVALLKHGHPRAWLRLMASPRVLLALGLAACVTMGALLLDGYYINGYGYGRAMTALGYSLNAWSFALLVMAALAPAGPLARVVVPGAGALARWSYALYLTHKPVGYLMIQPMAAVGIAANAWTAIPVVTLACLLGGWLLHRLVELPFLALRDRWLPTQFLSPGRATTGDSRSAQHA